jgi:hypothetical protein
MRNLDTWEEARFGRAMPMLLITAPERAAQRLPGFELNTR